MWNSKFKKTVLITERRWNPSIWEVLQVDEIRSVFLLKKRIQTANQCITKTEFICIHL